jgi:hypothetical protein
MSSPALERPLSRTAAHTAWICAFLVAGGVGCKGNQPEPAAAPVAPPAAVAPPPEPVALPAVVPPSAPPASPLRTALLAIKDLESFRALAGDGFRVVQIQGKRPPNVSVKGPRDHIDAKVFDQKIKPHLPHEPDPAGGEGEDFQCDDAQRSCVFKDENGHATTYLFESADSAKLREIQVGTPTP